MRYETVADVKLRLNASVVRVKERPVLVLDANDNGTVSVYVIDTGDRIYVKVKDLELKPVPLGYVNSREAGLIYCMRKPTRRYKQGLTNENLVATDVYSGQEIRINLKSEELSYTIQGKFPSIEECFTKVREGVTKALAFTREWAVAHIKDELSILYKGSVVGYVGDNAIMLNPDKYFLKESLTEALNV